MARWIKAQTPLWVSGNESDMQVLLYDQKHELYEQLQGKIADKIITSLDMRPMGDKVYFKGAINKQGKLVVNKDTITRDAERFDW